MSDLRGMTRRQLAAARHTNEVWLGRTHDSDDPAEQRRVELMCASMSKLIAEIDAELWRRDGIEMLKIFGSIIGVILWLGGAILGGYLFGGQVFAAIFWSGIVLLALGGVARWVHGLMNKPSGW